MHYVMFAYDATDEGAYERRMNARQAHLDYMAENMKRGTMVYGAALMNEDEKMIGSIIVTNFATRKEAEAWLEADPYVQQNVWGNITLTACKMGPSFEPLFNQIYKKSA